jgi:hypothetical protein
LQKNREQKNIHGGPEKGSVPEGAQGSTRRRITQ